MTELRARIGYSSVAFVTELLPRYFYQIAPDGVLLSLLTLQITEHTQDQLESIHEQGIRAVESFATAGADVIIMGGAPTNIAHGKMNLERALEELTRNTAGLSVQARWRRSAPLPPSARARSARSTRLCPARSAIPQAVRWARAWSY